MGILSPGIRPDPTQAQDRQFRPARRCPRPTTTGCFRTGARPAPLATNRFWAGSRNRWHASSDCRTSSGEFPVTGGRRRWWKTKAPIKAAQQRRGHSRPDILLKHYTHVLEASAKFAAETLSSQLSGNDEKKSDPDTESPAIGRQMAAKSKRWVM